MLPPDLPLDEAERLRALRELLILDTEFEERFDAVTAYCQSRFGVRTALISLIDADRQWFKSACGLDVRQTTRDISFCGHAILERDVMIVRDTQRDSRFVDNPLTTEDPFIRFYAGAQLRLSSGHCIGTLCLLDRRPGRLEPEEIDHLRLLARMVAYDIETADSAGAAEFVRSQTERPPLVPVSERSPAP